MRVGGTGDKVLAVDDPLVGPCNKSSFVKLMAHGPPKAPLELIAIEGWGEGSQTLGACYQPHQATKIQSGKYH